MLNVTIATPPVPNEANQVWQWDKLYGSSIALALSNAILAESRPILVIAPDQLSVSHLLEALEFFLHGRRHLLPFTDWETLPYDHFSPHQDIISERLATLHRLPALTEGAIVTSISTILQRLAPIDYLDAYHFVLNVNEALNRDILRTRLTKAGYRTVSQVREHGEFAIRGSLIDLFPMGSRNPFRIDLLDNVIDSIRLFSPETQLTLEKTNSINLLPAKEFPLNEEAIERFRDHFRRQFGGNPLNSPVYQDISEGIPPPGIEYYLPLFFDQTTTFFDYLPPETLVIAIGDLKTKMDEFWHEITFRYEQGRHDITRPLLPPDQLFLSNDQFQEKISTFNKINLPLEGKGLFTVKPSNRYEFATLPHPAIEIHPPKPLANLAQFVNTYEGRILFCVETMGRREVILQLFRSISLIPTLFETWEAFLASEAVHGIIVAPLEEGFCLTDPKIAVLTEASLYGKRVMQRRLRKKSVQDPDALIRDLTELQINDPVVHIDHGIGRYIGLQTLTVGKQMAEFLTLEYQGGDKLYVPVSSLQLISRYTGADPENTPISKLGTDQWQKAKRRAAQKVKDVAAELLDLYAKRAARFGYQYTLPYDQYEVFSAQFPFEETPDQLHAIEAVFSDMTAGKPMDRVICGDVGFGKTEVALRAAFIAVQNSKQVAILVPTTLLAQQHFQTFQDRFADWPITVDMLSRFRTPKETKKVLANLAEGKADIVIGTHKLLQQDIQFKDLGLVIIDEEHRFGVKQKERLKTLRSMVDILTMTATPIPRTLNMALAGIRDLSVIATPPAKRLAVKTFVHEYSHQLIQEAIQREIMRGGQVYFLHNEITTINHKAEEIARLVPESRICVAHGQMHERDLERIMSAFYHRQYNVLVCSTIIESGIDVPTANTIIIHRADKFGIAQLHQLRGRVGRSHHQAYAYLIIPPKEYLSSDAAKRLEAIASLDQLGIGFTLATHDLEIRGAGELLGEEQSGNMHEIGFTLYMDLLSRAVDALKAGKEPDLDASFLTPTSEIDLHLTALIPDTYLGDVPLRLQFYKHIANAKTIAELDEIQVEMIDRFGLLPEALKNLFAIAEIKLEAQGLGVIKIDVTDKGGKIEFTSAPKVTPETIIRLIQDKSGRFRLDGPTRLRFTVPEHALDERIPLVRNLLSELSGP